MRKNCLVAILLMFTVLFIFSGCRKEYYTICYYPDGASSGIAPSSSTLEKGSEISIKGNEGGLSWEDYVLSGWNTETDGSGKYYAAGERVRISQDLNLHAQWSTNPDYFEFEESDDGESYILVAQKTGKERSIKNPILPSYYKGKPVSGIGKYAFSSYYKVKLIGLLTIPHSVEKIDYCAFAGCSELTGSLCIPDSVSYIGSAAFSQCTGITEIDVEESSLHFKADQGILFSADETVLIQAPCSISVSDFRIPDGVRTIGDSAFSECIGLTGSLIIPDSVNTIGDSAFSGCIGLTGSLSIPSSVNTIGDSAFGGCIGLTGSLIIPDSVNTIGDSAFSGCIGFTGSLSLPNSLESIGYYAFSGCKGLTGSLTIPESVKEINDYAFADCEGFSGSLVIQEGLISIGNRAFFCCSGLTGSLIIPDSVTSIGQYAFIGCTGLSLISYRFGTELVKGRFWLNQTPFPLSIPIEVRPFYQ